MAWDNGQFLLEVRGALSGTLSWLGGTNIEIKEAFDADTCIGSSYGIVLIPNPFKGDEQGIGPWYVKNFSCMVYPYIRSGYPEGTRLTGSGTFTIGMGSFVDAVRGVLRNNRLQGTGGTYFLDSHIDSGLGLTTPLKAVSDNIAGAEFEFHGRKIFNS